MAEKQASYIQASSHPADTDRLVLEGLLNPSPAPVSGAGYGVGPVTGDLAVTQNGTPNMSVNVAAGHVWIDGTESATQGAYHCYNDATKNLVIAASDPTNPRKDLVVAKVQDAAYSGAVNAWTLAVVTGTPAASPAEPAVPANAVVLAMINVAALATTITNANITDRRRRACGLSGVAVCLSTSRPAAPYEGQVIYETDTAKLLVWNGSAWVEMVPGGAWQSWTPTWTNLTVGNAVVDAKYARLGRTIHYRLKITLGSTSSVGSDPRFSLPAAANAAYSGQVPGLGLATLVDATPSATLAGEVWEQSGGARPVTFSVSGSTIAFAAITATTPWTWAVNDVIGCAGTYEAAS